MYVSLSSLNFHRIIKQRTCSFKHLYFLFHEVLQSAKFFLSAALEIPIIQMMSCTDYYLDLDPNKTLMRYDINTFLILLILLCQRFSLTGLNLNCIIL